MHHDFIANHFIMPSFELTNAESYVQFIEKHYHNETFIDAVHHVIPRVTTTMSFYDITKL
jgi:hypothetical protein